METNDAADNGTKTPPPPPPRSAPPTSRVMPVREDCWSEEATHTLIEAWGERHLYLNRGNLRAKHWQEVANAVNALHGHTRKTRRTDIQCKNRIDTLKKKYKLEKAKTLQSRGSYVSAWSFFSRLDFLIGDSTKPSLPAKSSAPAPGPALALTSPVPVGPRSMKQKRPSAVAVDESFFRRNFAAVAAAAAEAEAEEDGGGGDEEVSETSRSTSGVGSGRRWKERRRRRGERETQEKGNNGLRELAEAIRGFGEVYERVEGMKQEQLIELEKHRMQFAKDLEFQRMKLLMDTQLQLAKIKRCRSSPDDADSYL